VASSLGPGLPLTASWALAYRAFAASLLPHPRFFRDEEPLSCGKTLAKSGLFRCSMGDEGVGRTGADTCNTDQVVVRSEDALESDLRSMPLGAGLAGYAELGPISPELALVDDVLAKRARSLLPDPPDRPPRPALAAPTPTASEPVGQGADVPPVSAARSGSRWQRTVVLAGLIFTAGALSGGFLGRKQATSPKVTLDAQPRAPITATTTQPGTQRRTRLSSTGEREALPPRRVHDPPSKNAKEEQLRSGPVTWAANVLGVSAGVDGRGVMLAWQRPADSDLIVVRRALGTRHSGVVVFRGRATSFRDLTARSCTTYRYTIINHDRKAHRSTGVPTSVVTKGCA
jgi:hypothetical protein